MLSPSTAVKTQKNIERALRRFMLLMSTIQVMSVVAILGMLVGFNYAVKVRLTDLAQREVRRAVLHAGSRRSKAFFYLAHGVRHAGQCQRSS